MCEDWRLKFIATHYGLAHQLDKLEEECKELVEAIEEHKALHVPLSKAHVKEEMEDVEILLDQIRWLLDYCDEERALRRVYKLNRTILRIKNECPQGKN